MRRVLSIALLDAAKLTHNPHGGACNDENTIHGFYSSGSPPDCVRCGLVEIIRNENDVPDNCRAHINIEIRWES